VTEAVHVNLAPLARFRDVIARDLTGNSDGPVRRAMRQWAAIYRGFLQERFNSFSRGGGDWKPLARSTILGRRAKGGGTRRQKMAKAHKTRAAAAVRLGKLEAKGQGSTPQAIKALDQIVKAGKTIQDMPTMSGVSILRDKGLLFNAVAPQFEGAPGAIQQDIPFGVRVGYGGPGRHPDGTATIADIARFHQEGGPHLPVRKIIVPPGEAALRKMNEVMQAAIDGLARE